MSGSKYIFLTQNKTIKLHYTPAYNRAIILEDRVIIDEQDKKSIIKSNNNYIL